MEIKDLNTEAVLWGKEEIIHLLIDTYNENFSSNMDAHSLAVQKYEDLKSYCSDGSAILLGAFDGGDLIGLLWAYRRNVLKEPRIHLAQLCVNRKFRGKGIGSQMLRYLEKLSQDEKVDSIELMATYQNEAAMRFYKKNGFEIERVLLKRQV